MLLEETDLWTKFIYNPLRLELEAATAETNYENMQAASRLFFDSRLSKSPSRCSLKKYHIVFGRFSFSSQA